MEAGPAMVKRARTAAWVGVCPTGKRGYFTRKDARRANSTRDHMTAYACAECGYWHLGHLSPLVVSGAGARFR